LRKKFKINKFALSHWPRGAAHMLWQVIGRNHGPVRGRHTVRKREGVRGGMMRLNSGNGSISSLDPNSE